MNGSRKSDLAELTERFRAAGASDPERWARSEIEENIAQLARFCFLRRLWPEFIDRYLDGRWVHAVIARSEKRPDEPFADAGAALQRLRERGATDKEISTIARFVSYEVVFGLLYKVGYGADEDLGPDYPGWRLMETRADELTGRDVGMLHEDLLGMDPSGREGRPA